MAIFEKNVAGIFRFEKTVQFPCMERLEPPKSYQKKIQ